MVSKCIISCIIKEGDLLAYLDGLAEAPVAAHIAQCAACQEEMAALQAIEKTFSEVLRRINCPESEMLLLYETKLLPWSERRSIAQHVADCSFCEREVAQLVKIPFAKALSPFERVVQVGKQILHVFRLPFAPQPAFALLGDDDDEPAIYQAGDYQVMLATTSPLIATNIWQIEGQIINLQEPLIPNTGNVSLLRQTRNVATDKIDEFGYFVLENLSPGEYTLHIDLPTTIIPIDKFVIP